MTDNDIGKIIKDLDPNKAHDHDLMGIRMQKIAEILFRNL